MKTIIYLVTPPETKDKQEKIRERFLAEKVFIGYRHPGEVYESLGEEVLGKRGFEVKEYPLLESAKDPESARKCLRTLIGMNLGKVIVVFTSPEFINNVLKNIGDKGQVKQPGSITTIWFTWERELKVKDVDTTEHLH